MELLFGITALIGIGASLAAARIFLRRESQRAMKAWRGIVDKLGGRYDPTLGFVIESGYAIVQAPRPIARSSLTSGSGFDHEVGPAHPDRIEEDGSMVLEALLPLPGGPRFAVRPREGRWRLMSFPGRTVNLGRDEAFDTLMIVTTPDIEGTYDAFNEQVQERVIRSLQDCSIYSDGMSIMLRRVTQSADPLYVEDALCTLAELANVDAYGLPALRALPNVRFEPPGGHWFARTEPRAFVVERGQEVMLLPQVHVIEGEIQLFTEACVICPDLPDFAAKVDGSGHASELLPQGILGEAVPLAQCGPGTVISNAGLLTFRWNGIERDPVRLITAARLLADAVMQRTHIGYR